MPQIFISLGSNINKEQNIRCAIATLQHYFVDLACSRIFESEAVGFQGSNFYNSVAGAITELSLLEVCTLLKKIEKDNGRLANDKKFSPRTLDLDLLFYDDVICQQPAQLPRDEITKNAFVLWPLAEIAADFIHPVENKTIGDIWLNYDKKQQKLWPVDLDNN